VSRLSVNRINQELNLPGSDNEWRFKENIDSFIASINDGDSDSWDKLFKCLVYYGIPYLFVENKITTIPTSPPIEERYVDAISFIHHQELNRFNPNKAVEALQVKSLKSQIKYDHKGNLFIKSPQMTEKTQSLKELMELLPDSARVLLVGHRTKLIDQTCKELGLINYQDLRNNKLPPNVDMTKKDYYGNLIKTTPRMAITWHSLYYLAYGLGNVQIPLFDVVLFDESDQVFRDFYTSDLDSVAKAQTDKILRTLVYHSDLTVCLDADLSDTTFNTVEDYRYASEQAIEDYADSTQIYINNFPILRGSTFGFLSGRKSSYDKTLELLQKGEILYITSELKGKRGNVHDYPTAYELHDILSVEGYVGVVITEEESFKPLVREIISKPNEIVPKMVRGEEIKVRGNTVWQEGSKLQYLITTPILETGWSCGQIGEKDTFTATIGMFPGQPKRIYTIHSMRQALRRARNVIHHYIEVGGESGQELINLPEVIKILDKKGKWTEHKKKHKDIDIEEGIAFEKLNSLDNRVLYEIRQQELCKTHRRKHLKLLLEEYGGQTYEEIPPSLCDVPELTNEERRFLNDLWISEILEAPEITERDRKELHYEQSYEARAMKNKYDVRKTFELFGEDEYDRPDLNKIDVLRWRNGDIRKCWNLRRLAQSLIEERKLNDDAWDSIVDSKHNEFKGEVLDKLYEALDVPIDEIYNHGTRILFDFHIPKDTVNYFAEQSVIDALDFIKIGGGRFIKDTKESMLTFLGKLAHQLDLNTNLVQPYAPYLKERYQKKWNIEGDVAGWLLERCKEEAKKLGRLKKIYKKMEQREKTKEVLQELFHRPDILRYIRNTKLFTYGLAYLRYTQKHLVVSNFEQYPIGIFSDLTEYDFREGSQNAVNTANQTINELLHTETESWEEKI